MRHRRSVFALLALAVFAVSVGAGAAAGYGRAATPGIATNPAGTAGIVDDSGTGTASSRPTSAAGTAPSAGPAASGAASVAGRSPSPGRTQTASWPLVAADSPGPPPGFVIRVPVLMYHRIAPADQIGRSLPGLVVPPDLFAAQLEVLVAAGWRSITAAELALDLAAGVQPRPRTFVITFDDGRRDGYTQAFPILQRLGLVATFFVITGRIGDASSLTASQLRRLASAGMEIGSHTVDHVRLTSTNPWTARLELAQSAARIAAVTGQRPTTFAYPFGGVDPLGQSLVLETGYAMAFTEADACTMSWPNRFAAPRIRVSAGTSPQGLLHALEGCTRSG